MLNKKTIQKRTSSRSSRRKVEKIPHPLAVKLKLLHHVYTGRVVHRRHTSYPILIILIVITGFFVFVGYDISSADSNIEVNLTVSSDPPTQGAIITAPTSDKVFKSPIIEVSGTCSITTEVVVYSNNVLVGSTLCTTSSTFQLNIQLFGGKNKLTALNYDGANQAGPITPPVVVRYAAPPDSGSTDVPVHPIVVPGITPTPPQSCAQKPTDDACNVVYTTTCENYSTGSNLPMSRNVRVAVVCMQRHASTADSTTIGVLVWGGSPPYALTIDWGDGSTDLLRSVDKPGYFTVSKQFKSQGQYTVVLQVSDKSNKQAYMQVTVDAAGSEKPNDFVEYIGNSVSMSWFDSPVPTYLLAVAIVIGFWAGDYFERAILSVQKVKTRGPRKRHA